MRAAERYFTNHYLKIDFYSQAEATAPGGLPVFACRLERVELPWPGSPRSTPAPAAKNRLSAARQTALIHMGASMRRNMCGALRTGRSPSMADQQEGGNDPNNFFRVNNNLKPDV